jgi:UMF1 family MFS transporter
VRLTIAVSALWWACRRLDRLRRLDAVQLLPGYDATRSTESIGTQVRGSLRQLKGSIRALRALPGTLRYLVSFLLFNDAIQAVIALSAVVLTQELFVARGQEADDATPFLLQLILLIQVVASWRRRLGPAGRPVRGQERPGADAGAVDRRGPLRRPRPADHHPGVRPRRRHRAGARRVAGAGPVAVQLDGAGGRQASFFGFYELAERGTAWVGTLVFAVVLDVTGSYRGALLSLLVLFVAGGALL